jgi:hypothetical protein
MTNRPSRRWIPVAATVALAAVILIAAVLIIPIPGKTTTTTKATTNTTTSLQTTSSALSTTGASTTTSATSLQTSLTTLTTSDYNSSLGLRLALSIGQSAIRQNQGILMNVSLVNTLATQNNLTAFTVGVNASLGPCSKVPLGVGIFRGNYAVGNVSDVKPMDIFGPGPIDCGAEGLTPYFSFAPSSDNVTLVYPQVLSGSHNLYLEEKANGSMQFWGYWTDRPVVPNAEGGVNEAFTSFPPGLYTIAAEDWWGQVTILHFLVGVNENPLTCATIASNSSFVGYTNDSVGPGPLKLEAYYVNPRVNDTVVLALSNTGNSTLAVLTGDTSSFSFVYSPYEFSPDASQVQRWQYYAPNGTLGYPAFFYPNQCVLISMTLSSPQFPLTLGFTDNQTQTFDFHQMLLVS